MEIINTQQALVQKQMQSDLVSDFVSQLGKGNGWISKKQAIGLGELGLSSLSNLNISGRNIPEEVKTKQASGIAFTQFGRFLLEEQLALVCSVDPNCQDPFQTNSQFAMFFGVISESDSNQAWMLTRKLEEDTLSRYSGAISLLPTFLKKKLELKTFKRIVYSLHGLPEGEDLEEFLQEINIQTPAIIENLESLEATDHTTSNLQIKSGYDLNENRWHLSCQSLVPKSGHGQRSMIVKSSHDPQDLNILAPDDYFNDVAEGLNDELVNSGITIDGLQHGMLVDIFRPEGMFLRKAGNYMLSDGLRVEMVIEDVELSAVDILSEKQRSVLDELRRLVYGSECASPTTVRQANIKITSSYYCSSGDPGAREKVDKRQVIIVDGIPMLSLVGQPGRYFYASHDT